MRGVGLVFSTRLPPDTGRKFAEMCERRKVSRSGLVRDLIEKALKTDEFLVNALGPDYGRKGEFVVDFNPIDEDDPTKGEPDL